MVGHFLSLLCFQDIRKKEKVSHVQICQPLQCMCPSKETLAWYVLTMDPLLLLFPLLVLLQETDSRDESSSVKSRT